MHSCYLRLLDLDLVAGYQFPPHTQVLAENSRVSTMVTTSDAEADDAAEAEVILSFDSDILPAAAAAVAAAVVAVDALLSIQ